MTTTPVDEDERARALVDAELKAERLFSEISARGLVAPGRLESEVSREIRDLGAEMFGTSKHWHKRVVRSGENTLAPARENPPDRRIGADDIAFVDLGPVFAEWEADIGRTYVLGDDPVKHRVAADLPVVWERAHAHFVATPDITGAQFYEHVCGLARDAGWEFGNRHSGHLVGEFPHEQIDETQIHSYITAGNDTVMRDAVDPSGRRTHWILEVHLVDPERGFGGFYEQLLTVRPS